jgi:hypothetical protein
MATLAMDSSVQSALFSRKDTNPVRLLPWEIALVFLENGLPEQA